MNRTSRTVAIADPLWTALETMSREMGVERDVLVNQAIFSLARQFGFIHPTPVSLLEGAPVSAAAPVAPVRVAPALLEDSPRAAVAEPPRAIAAQAAPAVVPVEVRSGAAAVASAGAEVRRSGADAVASVGPEAGAAASVGAAAGAAVASVNAEVRRSGAEAAASVGAAAGAVEARSGPEVAQPEVPAQEDPEVLRRGVAARIQELVEDVDRLVQPVEERLDEDSEEEEAADDESEEEESADDDADAAEDEASDSAGADDDASNQDAAAEQADANADDEEDEASTGEEALAALGDEAPAEVAEPPVPAKRDSTIIVPAVPDLPLHVQLDEGEPVLVARERFIIGRGPHCDLVVRSARVSREHVAVVREGAEFFIEDLRSSNGTWFQEARITRRNISDGDEYLLGGIRVTFTLR
ncbi:FHA domain-containing protein [Pyxidicoccus xibeiensis]|uniref:FHA domain-containing protein n=1 Tax=Pyxidicoccus xibeiensis TaxID=2906759 RepID=UPI0020A785BF|nr:FHA domain-containing protein [Pyxidicoccus xibeiensis]MCP3141839.1 FHA domain-containing protein [Pyxidicoccus xibeiensis]